jgi:hypothetical protein
LLIGDICDCYRTTRSSILGEVLLPWGSLEAKKLGIYDILLQSGAREASCQVIYLEGEPTPPRHYPSSTPGQTGLLSFFHPDMQETLALAAADAGVEIWRGAAFKTIDRGTRHKLGILTEGTARTIEARLIVGADGRDSTLATQLGFERKKSPQELFTVGLQLSLNLPLDLAMFYFLHGRSGRGGILMETKPGNYRAYLFHHKMPWNDAYPGNATISRRSNTSTKSASPPHGSNTPRPMASWRPSMAHFDGSTTPLTEIACSSAMLRPQRILCGAMAFRAVFATSVCCATAY